MRTCLAICLAAALLTPALWASGGSEAPVKPAGPVTLQVSWWGGDARHKGTIAAIELWNKNHPDITVEYSYSGWDGYNDKLTTQLAGGTAPDTFQFSFSSTPTYGESGVLADLTPYARTKFGDFAEGLWGLGTYKGKKLGAPTGAATYALIYNRTLLERLGVRLPTHEETWETFFELCKAATRDTNGDGKTDVWGVDNMYFSIPVDGLIPIYRQFGTTFWSQDLKTSTISTPAAQEIWRMFKRFEDAKVTRGPTDATVPEGLVAISAGLVAFYFGPASGFSSVRAAATAKGELEMVRIPQHEKGKSGCTIETPMLFGVYEKGKHKEQAIDFLSWLLTDVEAARTQGVIRGMYGTAKIRDALQSTLSGPDLLMAKLLNVVEAEGNATRQADPANRGNWSDIFDAEREKLMHGQVSLEEFFANVKKYADPVLVE